MTIDFHTFSEIVARFGLPGGLVFAFVWALYTRRLLWRSEHQDGLTIRDNRIKDLEARNDKLFDMVIGSQRVASKSLDIASQTQITER